MKINKALDILESWMPKEISEDFDNVGLLIGDPSKELRNILVTLDATEDIIEEAIDKGCNLILSYNPIIFDGIKTSSILRSPNETTTYFYEVTTNGEVCRVETTVYVNPLPQLLPANDMILCDDEQDGNAYNGLVSGFDLQSQEMDIIGNDTALDVLFFLNEKRGH